MLFEVSLSESMKIYDWVDEHQKSCIHKDIDGTLTYSFSVGPIGMTTKVKCSCGEELDFTDYESW